MAARIRVTVDDVGGGFHRLFTRAPKMARELLSADVKRTGFAVGQRMRALAPRSDAEHAPHIQDQIGVSARGLTARIGILDPGPTGIEADVALFNEYAPNKQPFMRPAVEAEQHEFVRSLTRALKRVEQHLQIGGAGGGLQ